MPWTKELSRHKTLNFVFTEVFVGVVKQFVGSESGQKKSVKSLQNMVYNTTQHPPPPAPHHTATGGI